MSVPVELFMTGLALGASQCLISCAPMLVIYVAGTSEGWQEGIKATIIFSLSRLATYVLLGLFAGFAGMFVVDVLHDEGLTSYIWIGAGVFVSVLGILMLIGKEPGLHLCQILIRHTIRKSAVSMALLGFTISIASPCTPFLGVLTYIACTAKNPFTGAFYAFCFGSGTALITPLVVVGAVAGTLPRLLFKTPGLLQLFRRSCGLLLLLFGVRLIISALNNLW